MMSKYFFVILLYVFALYSCTGNINENTIEGYWECVSYQEVSTADNYMSPIVNPFFRGTKKTLPYLQFKNGFVEYSFGFSDKNSLNDNFRKYKLLPKEKLLIVENQSLDTFGIQFYSADSVCIFLKKELLVCYRKVPEPKKRKFKRLEFKVKNVAFSHELEIDSMGAYFLVRHGIKNDSFEQYLNHKDFEYLELLVARADFCSEQYAAGSDVSEYWLKVEYGKSIDSIYSLGLINLNFKLGSLLYNLETISKMDATTVE